MSQTGRSGLTGQGLAARGLALVADRAWACLGTALQAKALASEVGPIRPKGESPWSSLWNSWFSTDFSRLNLERLVGEA